MIHKWTLIGLAVLPLHALLMKAFIYIPIPGNWIKYPLLMVLAGIIGWQLPHKKAALQAAFVALDGWIISLVLQMLLFGREYFFEQEFWLALLTGQAWIPILAFISILLGNAISQNARMNKVL